LQRHKEYFIASTTLKLSTEGVGKIVASFLQIPLFRNPPLRLFLLCVFEYEVFYNFGFCTHLWKSDCMYVLYLKVKYFLPLKLYKYFTEVQSLNYWLAFCYSGRLQWHTCFLTNTNYMKVLTWHWRRIWNAYVLTSCFSFSIITTFWRHFVFRCFFLRFYTKD
jgi:hypothetical protein